jgi:DNA-binding NarL/FixJ family response regulator
VLLGAWRLETRVFALPEAVGPVRVAIVNDYEIVVAGVVAMLAEHADRVVVVEVDCRVPVLSDVDVILFDTFAHLEGAWPGVADRRVRPVRVVVYAWEGNPAAIERALERGADGYLTKTLSALELVDALELVAAGKEVVSPVFDLDPDGVVGDWPGRTVGLSVREAEILAFIAAGLTNEEIAKAAYLSINTVKTYIRAAYRKIHVNRRSQAVAWALENGFQVEPDRHP